MAGTAITGLQTVEPGRAGLVIAGPAITGVDTADLARAGLVSAGPAITGRRTGPGATEADSSGSGSAGPATSGPDTSAPDMSGRGRSGPGGSDLPGTGPTAARAGPGLARAATAEAAQRANRSQHKKILRADFIAAPSH